MGTWRRMRNRVKNRVKAVTKAPVEAKVPKEFYDRKLTTERLLASRFYIYCLETALEKELFPRGSSLFAIEAEFRPHSEAMKRLGVTRSPLAQRLSRILGQVIYGRDRRRHELETGVATEKWMARPEIKAILAERVLVGDV